MWPHLYSPLSIVQVKVDTMPAWVWGKCKICKRECVAPPDGYFQHSQGDSWHHWDSWFFTHGLFCHVEFFVCLGWVCIVFIDKHITRLVFVGCYRVRT